MSNARIIEIPATRQIRSGKNNTMRKMRVAAYCRVSTEEEEQQGSFETQKLYYTEKINSTSEWELAGIYADDGISGIHTKKRDGFNQMIQDCKKHKIDLIRWNEAVELATFDYFDINSILSYLSRVNIVARWTQLDAVRGREMFERLMAELDGKGLIENKQ